MRDESRESRSSIDDIIDFYKKDVDRTLLRENLKLTVEERLQQLTNMQQFVEEERKAGRVWRDSEILRALKASLAE